MIADPLDMREKGFTLIELLVTVAIVGLLAAIALPQMSEYKKRAYNSQASSSLHHMHSAQEAYWSDYETYADVTSLQTQNYWEPGEGVEYYIDKGVESYDAGAAHRGGDATYCQHSYRGIMAVCGSGDTTPSQIQSCCNIMW